MAHFVDRLLEKIREKGSPVCIGFDPVYGRLPTEVRRKHQEELDAIIGFAERTFPVFAEYAPCLKIQSACFERYGQAGVGVYEALTCLAKQMGMLVIGDVKRGDIGISAEHYAAGCLTDPPDIEGQGTAAPDAVTVSSYFGRDGLVPFCDVAARMGKGVFALVRTSNPGGDAVQSLRLKDGGTLAEAVGGLVAEVSEEPRYLGESGYSLLGAVVGATKAADAAKLRAIMPRQFFLVPGYGAQGGSAEDVRACFRADGAGALITASRSVLYAYSDPSDSSWLKAVEEGAAGLRRDIATILSSKT